MQLLRTKYVFSLTLVTLTLAIGACSKHDGSGAPQGSESVPKGATMSGKDPTYGVKTASDLHRSLSVATGVSSNLNTEVNNRYSTVVNNLSMNGGREASGTLLKAIGDLSATYAKALYETNKGMTLSDPGRIITVDLETGFTAGGRDLFSLPIQTALVKSLVFNLTGDPATEVETKALLDTIAALLPTMPNTVAGKKLLITMVITIILTSNYFY